MNVLVVNAQVPFVRGGAEVQQEALIHALRQAGHQVDQLRLPTRSGPEPDQLLRSCLAFRSVDLHQLAPSVDRVICLKFPSWLVRHPRKTVWLVHQERAAFDLWDEGLAQVPEGRAQRELARAADRLGLGEADRLFAISATVRDRLSSNLDLRAQVLHPPPARPDLYFSSQRWDPFLLLPGRITPLKRHSLVLRALAKSRQPISLVVVGVEDGTGHTDALRTEARRLGVASRVSWLGRCSDETLRRLYSSARAVVFPARDEDFGLITPEAMLSERAVITCRDSGGPLELVVDGVTGLVTDPDPVAMGAAFDRLACRPDEAAALGRAGRKAYLDRDHDWTSVVQRLAESAS